MSELAREIRILIELLEDRYRREFNRGNPFSSYKLEALKDVKRLLEGLLGEGFRQS